MPLAMSNALGVSFVILTSLLTTPVFYISPRNQSSVNLVLHLAYTSTGQGHYDGLVVKDSQCGQLLTSEKIKCRCEVNSKHNKENYMACSHQVDRHSSCRCLTKGQACSAMCGCKGCNNPNGQQPITLKSSRSREPHTWQLLNTSEKYAADVTQGVWSA